MPKQSSTKKKEKKATGAPTGVRTAYMFFLMSIREDLKKKFPDLEYTEISKRIGAMWKELPEEEKEPYREEERDDKARHEEDMKEFEGGRIFEKTDYKRKKKQ